MKSTSRLCELGALILVSAASLPAQVSTARLEGFVTDPSGAVVAGARVTAVNTRTRLAIGVSTDAQGYFAFASLAPSLYRVAVEAPGFRKASMENLELNASSVVAESFRLEIGEVNETVTVEATTVRVQTSESSIGRSVNIREIDALPQLSRNPLVLSVFLPGTSVTPGDGSFTRINGTRQGSNNTRLDGIDANSASVPRLGLTLSPVNTDSVEEVRIVTNGAKAEYGRNAGGQIEMITRSGTNRFHGNLFEYLRNTVLNANTFFSNANGLDRPALIQNRFGGSVGGPVVKDKSFFFFNYQGWRAAGHILRNRTVLTSEARQGIFRWRSPGSSNISSVNVPALDPRGIGIDPQVRDLIALSPLPNNSDVGDLLNTAGFRFRSPGGAHDNQWTLRLDHNLRPTHRLFFRYNGRTDYYVDTLNNGDAVFPGRTHGVQDGDGWGYSAGSDWILSPT